MNKLWESQWAPNEAMVGRKGSEYFWARTCSSSCPRVKWPAKDALLYPQHWRSLKYRPVFLNPSFGWKLQAERKSYRATQGLGLCLDASTSLPQGHEPPHRIPLYRQGHRGRLQSLVQVKPFSFRFWSTLQPFKFVKWFSFTPPSPDSGWGKSHCQFLARKNTLET